MIQPESFPDHPFTADWIRSLESNPMIRMINVRFEVGDHREDEHAFLPDALVVQFVAVLEVGRAVAAHFDPVTETWSLLDDVVDVDPDVPEDVSAAIEVLEACLQEERGDDQEYGEAVCVELGIREPDRAEVHRRE